MRRTAFSACILLCAASAASLAAEHTAVRASDPARWDVPNLTTAQRLEGSLKEARNAMADALKECRASAERKACEAEARAQYRRDVLAAKQQASNSRPR